MSNNEPRTPDSRAGLVRDMREGLEGVTDGPWYFDANEGWLISRRGPLTRYVIAQAESANDETMHHLARCSPDNIRAILDALDAALARAEKAEAERDESERSHQDFRLQNDSEWKAKVDFAKASAEKAEAERDEARAELTARAKSMLRLRDRFINIRDQIEDEGDRTYFGSTNDADLFIETVQDLDGWHWHDIMRDAEREDVFEVSRKAHEQLRAAESRAAALSAQVERMRAALTWYGENARLCRLIHSEGDAGRDALATDGGKRARASLTEGGDNAS